MELRHLRYFVGIVEAGSLTKASKQLHVAQPALSVHLSNLEVELGVKLVMRSNRGIELTEDGALLYERALVMLRYHDEALSTLKRRHNSPKGSVSIGLPSTLPEMIAAQLYKLCRDELPEVRLYIADTSTAVLYEWLLAGKLDLIVMFNLPEDSGLDLTPMFWDEFVLVSAPNWGAKSDEVAFEELASYPLVTACRASSLRKILDDAAEKRGMSLKVVVESESFSALRSMALAGECCAILPRLCVLRDVEAGQLHARRIIEPHLGGMYSVANLNRRELSRAARAVRELLVRACAGASERANVKAPSEMMRVAPSNLFPINSVSTRRLAH